MAAKCKICEELLDGEGPAVVELTDDRKAVSWAWVSFLEDWRGGLSIFIHPVCFAETKGISALLELVTRRERIDREGLWKLIQERDDLLKGH